MSQGPTKAELELRVKELTEERDKWRDYAPSDKEAAAIARALKALEPLEAHASSGYQQKESSKTSVKRSLLYLAKRFGVTLYEERPEEVVYQECPSCRIRNRAGL